MAETMLPLQEVVKALRTEIAAAIADGKNEAVQFELGPIDVEFTVVAKREAGPNGKIKFEVFGIGAELGGDAKFASEKTQKIKLNLKPKQRLSNGSLEEILINRTPG